MAESVARLTRPPTELQPTTSSSGSGGVKSGLDKNVSLLALLNSDKHQVKADPKPIFMQSLKQPRSHFAPFNRPVSANPSTNDNSQSMSLTQALAKGNTSDRPLSTTHSRSDTGNLPGVKIPSSSTIGDETIMDLMPNQPSIHNISTTNKQLSVAANGSSQNRSLTTGYVEGGDRAERARKLLAEKERQRLFDYLSSPQCNLFSNIINPCPITPEDLDVLLAAGGTAAATHTLLTELDRRGDRVSSIKELIVHVRVLHRQHQDIKKKIYEYLSHPNCPIFINHTIPTSTTSSPTFPSSLSSSSSSSSPGPRKVTPSDVDFLVDESRSTPSIVFALIKSLALAGTKVPTVHGLLQLVRDAEADAYSSMRRKQRANQLVETVMTDEDRHLVLSYLASSQCRLFTTARQVRAAASEVDALIAHAGGVSQCLHLLRALDSEDRTFQTFPELSEAVHVARIAQVKKSQEQEGLIKQLYEFLVSPECDVFNGDHIEPIAITVDDLQQMLAEGETLEKTIKILQHLSHRHERFNAPSDLIHALREVGAI